MVIGYDELTLGRLRDKTIRHGAMRSLCLRFLTTFLVSRGIFFYGLKHNSSLVYGKDILRTIPLPAVSWSDRVKSFMLSLIILVAAPGLCHDREHFKIWCFKATKYYASCIETYARIVRRDPNVAFLDLGYDTRAYQIATEYRYKPGSYQGSLFKLYLLTVRSLFNNLPFIWRGIPIA